VQLKAGAAADDIRFMRTHRLRRVVLPLFVGWWAIALTAQDLENIQIHGFATQGFLYSSHNNYLSMNSSAGSLAWTQGVINFNDPVTDNLRVGLQLRMYQLGQFGGPNVVVDWALGDYKVNDKLGIRAGKIKIALGLFNDFQDIDPVYLWTLLPQGMYPVENEGFDLAELGGGAYGNFHLGTRGGRLQYFVHGGSSGLDPNGGYLEQLAELGFTFPTPPSGKTYGADLRWATPARGLTVGSGVLGQALDGTGPQGAMHVPMSYTLAYYAQWDRGKLHLAGEYWRTPFNLVFTSGGVVASVLEDQREWYPMVSYDLTGKVQVGSYFSHYVNQSGDTSQPVNYSKDWVVSTRYNFNPYLYAKLEGHFLHGTGLGYYTSTNPNGLQPNSSLLAARIGFSF